MQYIFPLIYPIISVLVLYLVNKKLNYKSKLVQKFGRKKYQIAIFFLIFFPGFPLILFFHYEFIDPVILTMVFSYHYFRYIPEGNH